MRLPMQLGGVFFLGRTIDSFQHTLRRGFEAICFELRCEDRFALADLFVILDWRGCFGIKVESYWGLSLNDQWVVGESMEREVF